MKRVGGCATCKCEIWIPDELFTAAMSTPKIGFCCAYGHPQHFSEAGIKKYREDVALKAKPAEVPLPWEIPTNSNVILFKRKGHEAQPHS